MFSAFKICLTIFTLKIVWFRKLGGVGGKYPIMGRLTCWGSERESFELADTLDDPFVFDSVNFLSSLMAVETEQVHHFDEIMMSHTNMLFILTGWGNLRVGDLAEVE